MKRSFAETGLQNFQIQRRSLKDIVFQYVRIIRYANLRVTHFPDCELILYDPVNFNDLLTDALGAHIRWSYLCSRNEEFHLTPLIFLRFIKWFVVTRRPSMSYLMSLIEGSRATTILTTTMTDERFHAMAAYFPHKKFIALSNTHLTLSPVRVLKSGRYSSEMAVFGSLDIDRLPEWSYAFKAVHCLGNWKSLLEFPSSVSSVPQRAIFYVSQFSPQYHQELIDPAQCNSPDLLRNLGDFSLLESEWATHSDPTWSALFMRRELTLMHWIRFYQNHKPNVPIFLLGRQIRTDYADMERSFFELHLPIAKFVQRDPSEASRRLWLRNFDPVYVSTMSSLVLDALGAGYKGLLVDVFGFQARAQRSISAKDLPSADWFVEAHAEGDFFKRLHQLCEMTRHTFNSRNMQSLRKLNRPCTLEQFGERLQQILALERDIGL